MLFSDPYALRTNAIMAVMLYGGDYKRLAKDLMENEDGTDTSDSVRDREARRPTA